MRAKTTTSVLRLGLLCATLGLAAVSTGFVACADALHLDPAGSGTGGGAKGDGGTEGGGGTCRSNPDCTYPKPVCDTIAQSCVECLVILDCAGKPGTVCSGGVCNCPNPDNPAMPLTYCTGATPACVDTATSADNCGTCGNACFGCTAGKCSSTWVPTSTKGAPEGRTNHAAVWMPATMQMFVWGGKGAGGTPLNTGALYDPAKKTWTPTTTTGAPAARYDTTAVWDDVENVVLVWGGRTAAASYLGDGFKYDPTKNAWSPLCSASAPLAARADHTAVWVKPLTGIPDSSAGLIIWGGNKAGGTAGDGAICDPSQNSWVATIPVPMPATSGPGARAFHSATWDTGTRMIIFGGTTGGTSAVSDTWGYTPMPTAQWNMLGMQNKRYQHTANWDPGSNSTIIFGGWDGTSYFGDASSLGAAMWTSLGAGSSNPEGRINHTAVILTVGAKTQLVVFGGDGQGGLLGTGWSLDTGVSGTWSALPAPGPSARSHHTAVANGATMIVWGGTTMSGPTDSGGIYTAQ